MFKKIEIFTDGSCLINPGPGGYAAILRYKKHEKIVTGNNKFTTNNRMELIAVIEALEIIKYPCQIIINTDSQYICKGITQWINKWKKHNWHNYRNNCIKNIDLWKKLDLISSIHRIDWKWIKGHSGHPENEQCNTLARYAAKSLI